MALVTLPNLGPDPFTVNAGVLNGKVDPLATDYNGNIQNVNIAAGAGIVYSKLTLTDSIVNADINSSAAIVDTKLATISTAGKVSATAISVSGLTAVTGLSSDYLVISDVSDSGNPKKALASDFTFTPAVSNALSGSVIQTVKTQTGAVSTGTTVMPIDDTIPQNTEGDEYMTRAITPNNASNRLLITVTAMVSHSVGSGAMGLALFQDTTAGALAATFTTQNSNANKYMCMTLTHEMAAGTTSSTTFKVRIGGEGAGTTTFNGISAGRIFGGVISSTIVIQEIKA